MVVSGNTARVGFLFVGGIVSFVVVVSLAIRGVRVIRSIRTSPIALIALILTRLSFKTAHMIHDELDCRGLLHSTVDASEVFDPCCWEGVQQDGELFSSRKRKGCTMELGGVFEEHDDSVGVCLAC